MYGAGAAQRRRSGAAAAAGGRRQEHGAIALPGNLRQSQAAYKGSTATGGLQPWFPALVPGPINLQVSARSNRPDPAKRVPRNPCGEAKGQRLAGSRQWEGGLHPWRSALTRSHWGWHRMASAIGSHKCRYAERGASACSRGRVQVPAPEEIANCGRVTRAPSLYNLYAPADSAGTVTTCPPCFDGVPSVLMAVASQSLPVHMLSPLQLAWAPPLLALLAPTLRQLAPGADSACALAARLAAASSSAGAHIA